MQVDAAEFGHQPVGDLRRQSPHDEVVDALLAPAADDVVTLAQLVEEQRNVVGIVLQIAVHRDDVFALSVVKARGERRGLPEVAAQLYHHNAAIDTGDLLQQPEGVVAAAVIHKHQLERLAGCFHDRLQPVVQLGDVFFFVVEGYDDGILKHRLFIITPASVAE